MESDEELERIRRRKLEEMMSSRPQDGQGKTETAAEKPIDLTDADFHQTVRRYPVMVVDFWAPWCGPCRVVSPVLEELSREMSGKASFGKVNVDDNPGVANEFGVQGIPTILIFKDGKPVDGLVGAAPKAMIEARIKPYIEGEGQRSSPYR